MALTSSEASTSRAASPNPFNREKTDYSAGRTCELRRYESILNGKGERMLLQAGLRRSHRNPLRDSSSQRSALVLTKIWDGAQESCRTELDVQSPHMKRALRECVPRYKDLDIEHKPIILADDPRCVFHYRLQLAAYRNRCNREADHEAAQHVQYLLDFMASQLISEIHVYNQLVENADKSAASLNFLNLWMAFVPGDLLYVRDKIIPGSGMRPRKLVKFKDMTRCDCSLKWCHQSRWVIEAHQIDSNGQDFGFCSEMYFVHPFEGFRNLSELDIMPLKFHPHKEVVERELLARAKKFRDLSLGRHHRQFSGVASLLSDKPDQSVFGEEDMYPTHKTLVQGRVILDSQAFSETRPNHAATFESNMKVFRGDTHGYLEMTDEELLICDNLVAGYSLNENKWGFFNVDFITEVDYNESAFDSLIFDQDYKDMILSLVKIHNDKRVHFDDVIRGKGKGMIFLLHGEPGVGKTLTAESVADYTRKPLLKLQAETLGSTAESVERALTSAFHVASKWNAVALLDEADVFLDQRGSADMDRACLVAVFLRVLEYYEGILFLTTNRISSFDKAFKSRIHLAIRYPALDFASRQKLWKLFLTRLPNGAAANLVAGRDLESIQDDGLNGRQIKNIVRTAHSLAVSDPNRANPVLELQDLEKALRAMRKFNRDFEAEFQSHNVGEVDEESSRSKKRRKV